VKPAKPMIYSGLHAVQALLRHRPQDVLEIWVLEQRADRGEARLEAVCQQAEQIGLKPQPAKREALERKAGPQHQGVVARARPRIAGNEQALTDLVSGAESPLLLALDGITDPHNLGACLRSADAAGVDAVLVPRRHSAGLTAVACRSAAGAAESVAWFEVTNLVRSLEALKAEGLTVVGAAGEAEAESLPDWRRPEGGLVLVMGAEGDGLRRLTREACDQLLAIPMRGEVDSLNVSVATGIMLYALSQRS
jgi:23S rRNA (guanosine2251-2'-O)-methyltransferase